MLPLGISFSHYDLVNGVFEDRSILTPAREERVLEKK
jgi:hypothetical protein